MNYLKLEGISKSYGEKLLFNRIDLLINQGDKVAIIARNGSGKSSLLRIAAGIDAPEGEKADYWINKDIKAVYLAQEPNLQDEGNILESLLHSDEHWLKPLKALHEAQASHDPQKIEQALHLMEESKAWEIETNINELLSRCNLPDVNFPVRKLSGGQRKRLALVHALCHQPDFLILDEPTNHLDLEMIEWLEKYLDQSQITLLMVTHDRYFLNRVCNVILELDRGQLYKYIGDYESYLEKKALRQLNEAVEKDKTEKWLKKELQWVQRMPKARTTKSKSRVDQFYDVKESLQGPKEPGEIEFEIETPRLGTKVLELHQVIKSYSDRKIINGFSYKFKPKDRVGIVGPNGAGKTTLLKLFTGQIKTDQGKIIIGETVHFGYYEQDGLILDEDKKVIDVVRSIADYIPLKKSHKLSAESLLEKFLFPRPQQQVFVSQLSGGERRRLYLLTVLISNPNFLILDEPTNDLDIITLNVLEEFLLDFPGVVVIVSHDRYFMDKIVEHLFVLEKDGQLGDFPGNYSRYRESLKAETSALGSSSDPPVDQPKVERPRNNKLSNQFKKEMNKIEAENEKLMKERDALVLLFSEETMSNDRISDLNKRLIEIQRIIDTNEMRWMELAEME